MATTHPKLLDIVIGEGKAQETVQVPESLANRARDIFAHALKIQPKVSKLRHELAELEQGPESVPQSLLALAKDCLRVAGKRAFATFHGACRVAEMEAVHSADPDGKLKMTVAKLVPSWTPSKSEAAYALKNGAGLLAVSKEAATVDGKEIPAGTEAFPTMTAVRTWNKAHRNAGKRESGDAAPIDPLAEAFGKIKADGKLRLSLLDLAKILTNGKAEGLRAQYAAILVDTVADLQAAYDEWNGTDKEGAGEESPAAKSAAVA